MAIDGSTVDRLSLTFTTEVIISVSYPKILFSLLG